MPLDIAPPLKGHVRIVNADGLAYEASNLVVYSGADILAQLLAGNSTYRISHMYFAYENTVGTPAAVTPARTDTAAGAFGALTSPKDYIRTPVLNPAQITSSGANFAGNRATFVAIANASTGQNGLAFNAASNSKVYCLGIVASPTGLVGSDVLYARFGLSTAIPVVGSGQVTATWMLEAN